MEEQENQEKQEQGVGKQIVEAGKQQAEQAAKEVAKKAAKEATKAAAAAAKKLAAQALAAIAPYIIPIIIGIIILALVIGGIYAIKDEIREVMSSISTSISSFIGIGDNGPVIPSGKEVIDLIDESLEEAGIDKETLDMGSERQTDAYLFKFMAASLSTQLPYIKNSTAQTLKDIALNSITGGAWNLIDKQEVQGIVKIKRRTGNNTKDLTFKKYEDFSKLVEENDTSAVKYFSIDEAWMLCIAKHNKVTTTNPDGTSTVENTIEEVKIPYQTMVSAYGVPFEFFIALQQISLNPEYVSAVADLIRDQGEIELTIFDSKELVTTEYTYKYKIKKKWLEEVEITREEASSSNTDTTSRSSTPRFRIEGVKIARQVEGTDAAGGSGGTGGTTNDGSTTTEPEELETEWVTKTSVGEEQTQVTTTVQEINSVSASITKANVWVIEKETTYTKKDNTPEYPLGTDGITTQLDNEAEPEEAEGEWKIDRSETTKETIEKEEWTLEDSKVDINSDKFLGLWKNNVGLYVEGAKYAPNRNKCKI